MSKSNVPKSPKHVYLTKVSHKRSFSTLAEEYLLFKKAQGISERTQSDILEHIQRFFRLYSKTTKKTLSIHVLHYMSQDNLSPYTYNLRLVYLRGFFNYCVEKEFIKENPMAGLKKRKVTPRIVDVDLSKVKDLLNVPDKTTYTGYRDYCLMLLQLDTGIRPSEALALIPSDYNRSAAQVTVRAATAKTRTERTLPLSKLVSDHIYKLLCLKPKEWGKDCPIFSDYKGDKTQSHIYAKHMSRYCKQLGEDVRITPYYLRHIFALNFVRNGGSPFALQKTLGHSDLNMTKTYIALTQADMKEAHMNATPINSLFKKRLK